MKDPTDTDSHYEAWLEEKRTHEAPSGFPDRVMESLEQDSAVERREWPLFLAKAAVLTLAAVVGLGRYVVLVFCLFFS